MISSGRAADRSHPRDEKLEKQEKLLWSARWSRRGYRDGADGLSVAHGVRHARAPSYVRTAFHEVRHTAKDSVPIQFDIERARDEISALAPAIDNNKEDLARAEVDVEHLQSEISTVRSNLETEKKQMVIAAPE